MFKDPKAMVELRKACVNDLAKGERGFAGSALQGPAPPFWKRFCSPVNYK